ncbi:MAG: hypothetical protein LBC47_06290 [Tannerella sp.]|nr:hypothetical protein [Tannerella sp.]
MKRNAMHCICTGGLKARKSLAHISTGSITMWHRRHLTPEALKGRNLFVRLTPLQGLANVMRSIRKVIELVEISALMILQTVTC